MIIRPRPRGWQLLYMLRGAVLPAIAPKVLIIAVLDALGRPPLSGPRQPQGCVLH